MEDLRQNGPDQVLPAESFTSTKLNDPVKLHISDDGDGFENTAPISVPSLLQRTAEKYPNRVALMYKENEKWTPITYKEYLNLVRTCAKAFIKLGLKRGHSVAILGFNSPQWFISDLAAIFAGGVAVGIYTTNSSEACYHCASYGKSNIIVVQDDKQLQKILAIKSRLPDLKAIIQYEGEPSTPEVLSWKELMSSAADVDDRELDGILKTIAINECCTLVFTSGTVGQPKAVMLSHDNVTFDALTVQDHIKMKPQGEVIVSYLPLSHIAAQMADIYLAITSGVTIYFADSGAMRGTLVTTLQEAQPTKFLAVPRVWEKIQEKMIQVGKRNTGIKKSIAEWAKNQALQYHLNRLKGNESSSWGYCLANALVFKKVKEVLGLNRCTLFASAAAPLAPDVKNYFLSVDIPILEVFGMSESSGPHSASTLKAPSSETIGITLRGLKSKLANLENDQGEICMFGRHVFMGYLEEEDKTKDTIDEDGWLHTGDLGTIDNKNYLYITGRLKELIITAGGENVAPVPIEQLIKVELPHISNAFLVGDKKKFLSTLLSFKTDVDSETAVPLDTLEASVQEWLNELGCPAKTVTEILEAGPDPKLLQALQDGIDKVNQQAVSNAQRIQKLSILPADFSLATGELGPTLKVKRNVVAAKYSDIIEKMYE